MPVRLYEAMYLVRADVIDDELKALMGRVADTITQMGGEIELHEIWERRALAYPIEGNLRGTYCICYFRTESREMNQLRRELELEEDVLRHIILVPNPNAIWRPITPEAAAPAGEAIEAAAEAPETEVAEEEVPEAPAEEPTDEDEAETAEE